MAYVLQLELSLRTAHERIRQLEAQLREARVQKEEEAAPVMENECGGEGGGFVGVDYALEQVLADPEQMGMCFGD